MVGYADITKLLKMMACLVIALSVALFPPSVAHAGMKTDATKSVHAAPMRVDASHQALHKSTVAPDDPIVFRSGVDAAHSDTSSSQCCSGVCLTAILIESPSFRDGTFSSSSYMPGATQMAHVDPNGFLRPPRQLT
jgi:hypothetical protein